MSKQTLHSLVVRFNKLSAGNPEKDSLRKIIAQEMENIKSDQTPNFTFS